MANIDANLKPMPALDTTTTTTAAAAAAPKASNGSVDAKIIASSSPKDDNNNNNNNETTTAEAPAAAAAAPVSHTLEENFRSFAKFGDIKSSGDTITLSNSDKWFKQAKIIDGKKITTTDTGIYWKAVAKTKKTLSLTEYNAFLETLAKMKKLEIDELKDKLKATGPPATNKTTSTGTSGAFGRLTDHTRYTGSHKQRFDEAGKGRGKAGRVDTVVNTGYVTGFKA